jgi:hypothetical protein
MWVMAQERVKKYIAAAQGCLVGNIVLSDKAPNLISVISVIRWMFLGRKERYLKVIPPAGIAPDDIAGTVRFGEQIKPALLNADFIDLQSKLVTAGAVDVRPGLVMIEKRGIIFFRLWAAFIRRKGSYGTKARIYRVRLFKYYLITMLYLVSPFASLLYQLTRPFRLQTIKKQISLYQSN